MPARTVIGIDPGPATGMVMLRWRDNCLLAAVVLQCNAVAAPMLLDPLLNECDAVAIERFIVGPRAARSAAAPGERTRTLIGQLTQIAQARGLPVHLRSAAQVKPWATDTRLDAAGLLEATKGARHARDAARHALYTLVRDYTVPDPMRTKGAKR